MSILKSTNVGVKQPITVEYLSNCDFLESQLLFETDYKLGYKFVFKFDEPIHTKDDIVHIKDDMNIMAMPVINKDEHSFFVKINNIRFRIKTVEDLYIYKQYVESYYFIGLKSDADIIEKVKFVAQRKRLYDYILKNFSR